MYRPLPKEVTIKKSYIEGLGLFANEHLVANTKLGVSHIKDDRFEDGYIRTPLGGFVNHSYEPNCIKDFETEEWGQIYHMRTIRAIKKGEELFLNYTFYSV